MTSKLAQSEKVTQLSVELEKRRKTHSQKILIFASPHREELEVLNCLIGLKGFFFICVPQEVEENSLLKLKEKYLKSSLKISLSSSNSNLDDSELLLVDEVGFLSELYKFCDLTILGGGFSGKPHNLIEPVIGGSPVLAGHMLSRAPEAQLLLEKGCLKAFQSQDKLVSYVTKLHSLIALGGDNFNREIRKDFLNHKEREAFYESLPRPEERIASFLK
jgi:3-deoxy-D-manno-octulosonic-acid transferase